MDPDRDALARFVAGDEKAFEELVIRHESRVRNVIHAVVRDRGLAEDLAQDTFLTAHAKAPRFRAEGSVRSWLLRIAVRKGLDELRRRKRRGEEPLDPHRDTGGSGLEGLETGWDLDGALAGLSPDARAALMMREVDGSSYREIADSLGWPMGTVATRLHRARLELRRALSARIEEKA